MSGEIENLDRYNTPAEWIKNEKFPSPGDAWTERTSQWRALRIIHARNELLLRHLKGLTGEARELLDRSEHPAFVPRGDHAFAERCAQRLHVRVGASELVAGVKTVSYHADLTVLVVWLTRLPTLEEWRTLAVPWPFEGFRVYYAVQAEGEESVVPVREVWEFDLDRYYSGTNSRRRLAALTRGLIPMLGKPIGRG